MKNKQRTIYKTYFVSGIDTGIGKTFVTGLMAKYLLSQGINVITQKPVETGNSIFSADIQEHRDISGIELNEDDKNRKTNTYLFDFPASPHLSAKLAGTEIEREKIHHHTDYLVSKYDTVIIEGAGGLYVPLSENYLTIDEIKNRNYPLILVSSNKLGSINHTLMSLELCIFNKINLIALIYNQHTLQNDIITDNSFEYFEEYLRNKIPECKLIKIPYSFAEINNVDFSRIFF